MPLVKGGENKTYVATLQNVAINVKDGSIVDKDGIKYVLSALNPELKPSLFTTGKSYEVELLKGNGGSIYIQKVLQEAKAVIPLAVVPVEEPKQEDKPPKPVDRNTDIGNRGFIQSASIAASNICMTKEDHAAVMELVFNNMMALLNKVNK